MVTRAKFQWSHDSSDSVREEDEDEVASSGGHGGGLTLASANHLVQNKSTKINILVAASTETDEDNTIPNKTKPKKYLRHRYKFIHAKESYLFAYFIFVSKVSKSCTQYTVHTQH